MTNIKRYAIFAGDFYYPSGGWDDFVAAIEDQSNAVKIAKRSIAGARKRWAQVIDLRTGERIFDGISEREGGSPK